MSSFLIFITFSTLITLALLSEKSRHATFSRSRDEWIADMAGLFIQGIIIPAFPFLVVPVLTYLLPKFSQRIELHAVLQFILSFVVIDYLYYWNHRIFHRKAYWPIHRMHHSARHLDIFATSRNSLVTSFLFVYVWSQILAMFLLKDPTPFLLGLALTFALDLWRHSGFKTPETLQTTLGWALIIPEQHVLHHSLPGRNKNYGANLIWWDKIHGTYSGQLVLNQNLERKHDRNVWKELVFPRKGNG